MSILSGYFKYAPPHSNDLCGIKGHRPFDYTTFESITFVNVSHKLTQNMVKYETEDNLPVFFSGLHR